MHFVDMDTAVYVYRNTLNCILKCVTLSCCFLLIFKDVHSLESSQGSDGAESSDSSDGQVLTYRQSNEVVFTIVY